jgi:hypothetical protein
MAKVTKMGKEWTPEGVAYAGDSRFHLYKWCRYARSAEPVGVHRIQWSFGEPRALGGFTEMPHNRSVCSCCLSNWRNELAAGVTFKERDFYLSGSTEKALDPETHPKQKDLFHLWPTCDLLNAQSPKGIVHVEAGLLRLRCPDRRVSVVRACVAPVPLDNDVPIGRVCPVCDDRYWFERGGGGFSKEVEGGVLESFVDEWFQLWDTAPVTLPKLTELAEGFEHFGGYVKSDGGGARQRFVGAVLTRNIDRKIGNYVIVQTNYQSRGRRGGRIRRFRLLKEVHEPEIRTYSGKAQVPEPVPPIRPVVSIGSAPPKPEKVDLGQPKITVAQKPLLAVKDTSPQKTPSERLREIADELEQGDWEGTWFLEAMKRIRLSSLRKVQGNRFAQIGQYMGLFADRDDKFMSTPSVENGCHLVMTAAKLACIVLLAAEGRFRELDIESRSQVKALKFEE